jgi:hypothetical protein
LLEVIEEQALSDIDKLTKHAIRAPAELNALENLQRAAYRKLMAEKSKNA